jgi:hypothetical protein
MQGEVLPMPATRRTRLKQLEQVIEKGWSSVVAVGQALREIRDDGLYLELDEGLTFEQYVKSRWAMVSSAAYNHIDAAEIAEAVSSIEETPILNLAVSRELAPLLRDGGSKRVAEAWKKISKVYEGQRPPTALEVHRVLVSEGYRPKPGRATGGPVNARILLGQFGDKLIAAERRFEWFVKHDINGRKVGASTRKLAASYADRCERLAQELRDFAEDVE